MKTLIPTPLLLKLHSLRMQGKAFSLVGIPLAFFSHKDVKTTMIYTHVLNRGGWGVKSPVGRSVKESLRVYIETIYHTAMSLVDDLTPSTRKAYVDLGKEL